MKFCNASFEIKQIINDLIIVQLFRNNIRRTDRIMLAFEYFNNNIS